MTAPLKPSVLCDLQPASDIRSAAFWAECQAATKVLSTVHMASAGPSSQSEPLCNGTLAAHARITGRYEDGVRERGRKKKKKKSCPLATGLHRGAGQSLLPQKPELLHVSCNGRKCSEYDCLLYLQ